MRKDFEITLTECDSTIHIAVWKDDEINYSFIINRKYGFSLSSYIEKPIEVNMTEFTNVMKTVAMYAKLLKAGVNRKDLKPLDKVIKLDLS